MEARMPNPAFAVPDAMPALVATGKAITATGLPESLLELLHLRASQINGCGVCVVGHGRLAKKEGETDDRINSVAAWREAPWFTDAERAALALTEEVTRLADRGDAVPDPVWAAAAEHYTETELGALVLSIGLVNLWNRINLATRQVAGAAW